MTSGTIFWKWFSLLATACSHFWSVRLKLIVKLKSKTNIMQLLKECFRFSPHLPICIIPAVLFWAHGHYYIFPLSDSSLAPYKTVTKYIQRVAEKDEVLLTCQCEGYPNSSVIWQDGQLRRINPSTTVVSTPDKLFKITSEIRVRPSDKNNYTCNFTNDGYSAMFYIPGKCLFPCMPRLYTLYLTGAMQTDRDLKCWPCSHSIFRSCAAWVTLFHLSHMISFQLFTAQETYGKLKESHVKKAPMVISHRCAFSRLFVNERRLRQSFPDLSLSVCWMSRQKQEIESSVTCLSLPTAVSCCVHIVFWKKSLASNHVRCDCQ